MKTNSLSSYLTLVLIGLICATSCRHNSSHIGDNLLPESNYIGVYHTDTTEILCHSLLVDSLGTKNVSSALLGAMYDPIFGNTEAGFYTQIRLSSTGQNFGESPILDSIVLQLYLTGYYGDTNTYQNVSVYEITDTIAASESYYSFSTAPIDPIDLANNYQFKPRPRTSSYIIENDTIKKPVIRIPLSNDLGNKLINAPTSVYQSAEAFKAYFKGLYVTANRIYEGGAMSYLTLTNNTHTLLQVYYKENAEATKQQRYDYYITSKDVYFNHFEHDYETADEDFRKQVLDDSISLGQQCVFLQSMGGVRTFIHFPNINHWKDTINQHIVINQAKLILPGSTAIVDTNYKAPTALALVGIGDNDKPYILPDFYEGAGFYGGTYDSKNDQVYFRITEYMQDIILGNKPNNGIYMTINGASTNAQRWILNGPQAPDSLRMKLEVTYSLVNME